MEPSPPGSSHPPSSILNGGDQHDGHSHLPGEESPNKKFSPPQATKPVPSPAHLGVAAPTAQGAQGRGPLTPLPEKANKNFTKVDAKSHWSKFRSHIVKKTIYDGLKNGEDPIMFTRERSGNVLVIPYPRGTPGDVLLQKCLNTFPSARQINFQQPGRISIMFPSKELLEAEHTNALQVGDISLRVFRAIFSKGTRIKIKVEYLADAPLEARKEALRTLFSPYGTIIAFHFHHYAGSKTQSGSAEFYLDLPESIPRDAMIPRVASILDSNALFTWGSGSFCYRCGESDHTKINCYKPADYILINDCEVKEPIMARVFADKSTPLKRQTNKPSTSTTPPTKDGFTTVKRKKNKGKSTTQHSNTVSFSPDSDTDSKSTKKARTVPPSASFAKETKETTSTASLAKDAGDTSSPHQKEIPVGLSDDNVIIIDDNPTTTSSANSNSEQLDDDYITKPITSSTDSPIPSSSSPPPLSSSLPSSSLLPPDSSSSPISPSPLLSPQSPPLSTQKDKKRQNDEQIVGNEILKPTLTLAEKVKQLRKNQAKSQIEMKRQRMGSFIIKKNKPEEPTPSETTESHMEDITTPPVGIFTFSNEITMEDSSESNITGK